MKQNIFEVPKGYFEDMAAKLNEAIAAEESELEQNEHLKAPVFQTPPNYFEGLSDKIMAAAEAEDNELHDNVHLKETPFTAPEGYFDQLSAKLNASVAEEQEAQETKVVPLYQKNWFKMAIAAVLVVGFFFLRGGADESLDSLIAQVDDETAFEYLLEDNNNLDLLASADEFDTAIAEILEEETAGYEFNTELNLELDYDFEFFEQ